MMPRFDGPGLVRQMRWRPGLRHVPVVVPSAGSRVDPAEWDGVAFVAKPFDVVAPALEDPRG